MTDRTPEQINHNIDQILAICAETSRLSSENTRSIIDLRVAIAEMRQGISELTAYTGNRTQQHDLELDDHDLRVERLERDHTEHADRMAKLEDIQADIRGMMQMLTRRLSGEPPSAD